MILTGWLAMALDGGRGGSGRGSGYATVLASQEQTLSGKGARVYTAHRVWLGVVTGISAASSWGVLHRESKKRCHPNHAYNFVSSLSICKILSLLRRAVNFQQNSY